MTLETRQLFCLSLLTHFASDLFVYCTKLLVPIPHI